MVLFPISISGALPTIGAGVSIIGKAIGLDANIWVMKIVIVQDAGGVQDIFLQSQDLDTPSQFNAEGPWSDIAHLTQIAAGASTVAFRVGFYRGLQAAQTSQAVNPVDGTPTLAAGTVLTWANGRNLRVVASPGAGANGSGRITVTGFACND